MGFAGEGQGREDLARVHPSVGEGEVNSYQRRLGLVFGATALLTLLVSSGAQSTIGYAQFAYALQPVIQSCPTFPTPIQLMAGLLTAQNGAFLSANTTSASKWHQSHTYIKYFSLGGLDLNATSIFIGALSAKILFTQEYFNNNTGHFQKTSSVNTTYTINLYKLSARIIGHQATITANNVIGSLETVSTQRSPTRIIVSVENVKATISCGAT